MLEVLHQDLPKPPNDTNSYTLGSIGMHNVVVAYLPKDQYGIPSAAAVAVRLIATFPAVRFGLMVGIGGGIPPKDRLGDVVAAIPIHQFSGVVQWDIGKETADGFQRSGALNNPPTALLTATGKLETTHNLLGPRIPEYLQEMEQKRPRLASKYLRSDALEDVLFRAHYSHNEAPHLNGNLEPEIYDDYKEESQTR